MEPGQLVEFIDSQKIICATVLESKNLRLRLLTENNREVKLSAGRLTHRAKARLDPSLGRDRLVARLKETALQRRALSHQVDIATLWEVLHDTQEWIDLPTMTALCFPETTDDDREAAVIRAFFNDRLYFKFSPEQFFPHSAEKLDQIMAQRNAEAHQSRILEQGGAWLQHVLKGQSPAQPDEAQTIVRVLKSYCLLGKECRDHELARAILKRAGHNAPSAIFGFLVRIGEWHPDENLDLLRHNISLEPPPPVQRHADVVCHDPPVVQSQRRDLRGLSLFTIDGPDTLDYDDAISIEPRGDHTVVGVHITDVGHCVAKADPIDQEALARGSSIYMPDRKISMLPDCLALDICSLKAGADRPAISTLVTLSHQGTIIDFEVVESIIRVEHRLTFTEVDRMLTENPGFQWLHMIAQQYRSRRLDHGAMLIRLPEINIRLGSDGMPEITRIDRERPSHLLVSELMILANDLAARFLCRHNLPAVFRSQAKPRERLFEREEGTLFQNWMQRKQISRFSLASTPEPHSGLGLPAYVTCTSPIRKYYDLVTQRQMRAALGLESPYSAKEIDLIIASLTETMALVGRIQFRRYRYWLLKHLEGRIGHKCAAMVLHRNREGHVVLLPDYLIECPLSGADNVALKPDDLVQITIQHANARNDVLNVYLG